LAFCIWDVESGDDEVLKRIKKNATHDEMVEAGKKVKEAGILLSVTVILGLGGNKGSAKHVSETARILTEMDPDYAGALTLTLIPETPIYKELERGEFELVTPFDSLQELKGMVEQSTFTNCFSAPCTLRIIFRFGVPCPRTRPRCSNS